MAAPTKTHAIIIGGGSSAIILAHYPQFIYAPWLGFLIGEMVNCLLFTALIIFLKNDHELN